jgi:serine/threonine-protein kinase
MTEQLKREQRRIREMRDPLIGKYVDTEFQVLSWVGRGAYSNVYRAAQTTAQDRIVALKVIRRAQSRFADEQAGSLGVNPFGHELEFARLLKHGSATRVLKVGRSELGVDYIAMEFVEGVNLGDHIRDSGPLSLSQVARLGDELLGYVDDAHRNGFAHCDIKPDNVMMRRGGTTSRYKILDLGQARWFEGQGPSSQPAGTPAFLAPEVALGRAFTPASEVYACGTVLYEALTGEHAIQVERPSAETYTAYLRDVRNPIPTFPVLEFRPDCPEALADLVEWALEHQPANRPQSAQELREALAQVAQAEGLNEDRGEGWFNRMKRALRLGKG